MPLKVDISGSCAFSLNYKSQKLLALLEFREKDGKRVIALCNRRNEEVKNGGDKHWMGWVRCKDPQRVASQRSAPIH